MKKIFSFFFAFAAFVLPGISFAQNTSAIHGRIFTSDNKPAAYVSVTLQGTKVAAETSRDGFFRLPNLPSLSDTLIISSVGFYICKISINVPAYGDLDLGNIYINYAISELQNIEITGHINRSYKSDFSFAATKTQTAITDIPQTVSTVTRELINDRMQSHLTNAMDDVAGVTHYSGYEEYNIRGLHAENPRLINGLRTFNTLLTSPMLVNVERIEVIRGPASVLYGNQDPGGTVNVVTKKPLAEKQYILQAGAGRWNNYTIQTDATGPLNKSKSWLYRFNAGYENTRSFRTGLFLRSWQVAPSFTFAPNSKLQLNVDISVSNVHTLADRGQPAFKDEQVLSSTPVSLCISQPGDYLNETNISTAVSGTYRFNKNISFNTGYLNYITRQSLSEHGIQDFISNDSVSLYYKYKKANTITHTFTDYFTFKFNTGDVQHQLLAGYDFIITDLTASQWNGELPGVSGQGSGAAGMLSLRNPQYFERPVKSYVHTAAAGSTDEEDEGAFQTHGVYVQEQVSLHKWQLRAALRAEFYTAGEEEDGDSVTYVRRLMPSVGITYTIAKNLNLYAVFNEGFDPFEPSSVVQVFNEGFKPVNSHMVELGAKASLSKNKLFASLAFYRIIINNLAVNANDTANPDLFVQRGQQRSAGVEAEIQGNLLKNLSASAGYAFNVSEITKSISAGEVGKATENAPRHSSTSWFKYTFSKGIAANVAVAVGHTQAGRRHTLTDNIILPGYCIFNTAVYYTYKRLGLGVIFNNVTNKTYWSSAYNNKSKWPGAPANYMLRISYGL